MPIVQFCENRYMNMYRTRLLPILVVDSCSRPCYNANTERKFGKRKEEEKMKAAITREQLAQLSIEKLMIIAEIVEAMLDSQQAAPDSVALAETPQRVCG